MKQEEIAKRSIDFDRIIITVDGDVFLIRCCHDDYYYRDFHDAAAAEPKKLWPQIIVCPSVRLSTRLKFLFFDFDFLLFQTISQFLKNPIMTSTGTSTT